MKKQFKLVKDKNSFQIHWEKKAINEKVDNEGNKYLEIEGYASTKDKDRGHDIVEPKAFENALATYMTNPVVLLQHKHDKPIGTVTEASIDNKGLYIKANITENTDNVMSAIKNGVLRTFSIGYGLKEGDYEVEETVDENGKYDYTTTIKNLELYEISVVSVPMNAYALMKSIEDCFEVKEVEEEAEGTCIDGEVNIEHGEEVVEEEDNEEEAKEEEKTVDDHPVDKQPEDDEEEDHEQKSEEIAHDEETGAENDENRPLTAEDYEKTIEAIKKADENVENEVDTEEENENSEEEVEDKENNKEEENNEATEDEVQETKENQEEVETPKIDETTEVEEATENEVETPTNDEVVDETSNDEVVEAKSIEEVESKSFKIDEKAIEERIEKKFEAKFVEQTKKVEDLSKELEQTKSVLKMAVNVLKEMDGAVRNTVIKTGATYSQVAKRKSAWGEVISKAQSSL